MEIRRSVLNSLKWLAIGRALAQLTRWAITFFVIRLLSPDDYGLMAMADLFLSFLALFSSAGLASAIIQAREYTTAQLRALLGVLLLVNGVIMLIAWFGAPAMADFYNESRLIEVVHWMQIGFLLAALEALPMAILSREMRFRAISMIELAAGVSAGIVTLVLAFNGYGFKALIVGYLVEMGTRSLLKNIMAPAALIPSFRFSEVKEFMRFGGLVTASTVLWFIYTRYDVFIAGRLWDTTLLGFYAIALQIAMIPMDKAMSLVQQVAFPAFSSQSGNMGEVRRYVLKANRLGMLVVFPVFFGMSLTAPAIMPLVLGEKWADSVLPMQLLCLVLPLRVSMDLLGPALKSVGKPGVVLWTVVIALAVMAPALTIGAHYGLAGLALAWVLGFPVAYLLNIKRSLSALGVPMTEFFRSMAPSVLASLGMYAIAWGIDQSLLLDLHLGLRFTLLTLVGIVSYFVLVLMLGKDNLFELKALFLKR